MERVGIKTSGGEEEEEEEDFVVEGGIVEGGEGRGEVDRGTTVVEEVPLSRPEVFRTAQKRWSWLTSFMNMM